MLLKEINIGKAHTTHMPMLIKTVQMSKGPILELGAGIFSTPLLHWLCSEDSRRLDTYESHPDYYDFAKRFQSKYHRIHLTKDWQDIDLKKHYSVVLIDHWPEKQRGIDVIKLKNNADYIVLHDSELEKKYGYDKVWKHFKYIYHWKFCTPHTTILSNFKDVSNFYEKQ